jgi:pyruvate kinase
VARAAVGLARETDARALVVFTTSGSAARFVSQARPPLPVIVFSPSEETRRRMALHWGLAPERLEVGEAVEALVADVSAYLPGRGLASSGDRVVMVFGMPFGRRGSTNSIRVETIG